MHDPSAPAGSPSVAVIGASGAIGATVAAVLHARGTAPLLVGRTARSSVTLDTDHDTVVVPGPVRTDPEDVTGPVDVVLLAVKATQTAGAARWLQALCTPATVVCVLQNGIEQVETVGPLAPTSRVVPAVVWFPAVHTADGHVRLLDDARLTLPDTPGAAVVADLLHGDRCSVELTADFRTTAWRKLLQNAAAGLMALTVRRSGVFRRDDLGALALAYLTECLAVARADGARLDDAVPAQVLDGFRSGPVDRGTSILADREAGRPLEWDARNGVVRRKGGALGVPTPISDVVVPLLAAASDGPG